MSAQESAQSAEIDQRRDSARDEWWCGFCGRTHRSLACPPRVVTPPGQSTSGGVS